MSGIFGLSSYNDQNLSENIPDRSRESSREYGYFGGGLQIGPIVFSTVDRIDYSNDTAAASVRGPLSVQRYWTSGVGNSNFGYFGGGLTPSLVSTVDRIDYSNDTATASVRGPLRLAKYATGATGNSNFGYFGGGSPVTSSINRVDYANDISVTNVRGPLSLVRRGLSATGNSNFGYFSGGIPTISTVDRINYSNDTATASARGPLSAARNYHAATGNSNFGYLISSYSPDLTSIDRINYSNDTATAVLRGPLASSSYTKAGTGNSNFGYTGGGGQPTSSEVNRIDYSNDTQIASVRGSLSLSRLGASATSSHSFGGSPISQYGVFPKPFGYFGGGATPSLRSQVDRIDYSNDTSIIRTRGLLGVARGQLAASGNSNFGYFSGGNTGSFISTVDRIDYNNDLQTALVRGPLSSGRYNISASGNSSFGWFCGGREQVSSAIVSTVDRIDYSNDSNTLRVRGSMSSSLRRVASTGTYNFGYIGGGDNGGPDPSRYISTIQRIDYANDTSTALNRSTFLTKRNASGATGTINFGYFGAGYNETSTLSSVERLDYSTDTTAASSRGSLSLTRHSLAATGNSNFGYFGGGIDPAPSTYSTIDRLDFSNDISNATIRSSISESRFGLAATSLLTPSSAFSSAQLPLGFSNTDFQPTSTFFDIQSMRRIEDTTNASVRKRVLGSYGYLVAGLASGPTPAGIALSSIERIDYSNDTAITSIRSNTSTTNIYLGGEGNSNFGYVAGGMTSSPGGPTVTTVNRIDYSNDSAAVSVRSPVTGTGYRTGFGNNNFGYFVSSQGSLNTSRIDYSNDTNVVSRNTVQRVAYYRSATGNTNFGYIHEGFNTSVSPGVLSSMVERVDYSNDSSKTSIRGPLSLAKRSTAATGNSNFGYFGGGGSPGAVSTVDRINYLNDTATASVRGPLSQARTVATATGNSNFGYYASSETSRIDRINYSNDTATADVRGSMNIAKGYGAGVTNAINS